MVVQFTPEFSIPERNFNRSNKHGENGNRNWADASPLLCSKERAQVMLNIAIPDFTDRATQLYYFDEEYNTFVEYYYEGDNPQKLWHGYHLENDDWDRVPNRILSFFCKSI